MLSLFKQMIGQEATMYDEATLNFKHEAFSTESEYLQTKRAEIVAKMSAEGKLLTQGFTPASIRGASVLNSWLETRQVKAQ
jgi:hypothetical protein